ncbi:MAG: translation initiation factor IF-2 [Ruminococcaceae bacterium]|nr:translation initiation factor IF-2 [Oscillospiraceae bacterium]
MGNEKIKIHDLAKKLNTTGKRIVEKLHEINIEKTTMASLNQDELKALYNHIGYKPENEKTVKSSENTSGTSGVRASNQTKPSGIIMRRVVYNEDSSYSDATVQDNKDLKGKKNNKPTREAASSGLRSGYAVRNNENYDDMVQSAKAEKAKSPEAEVKTQPKTSGPVVKRVTRIKAQEAKPEEKVVETVPEKKPDPVEEKVVDKVQQTEEVKPVVKDTQEKAQEPVKKVEKEKKPEIQLNKKPVRITPERPPVNKQEKAPAVERPAADFMDVPVEPKRDSHANKNYEKPQKKGNKKESSRPQQNVGKDKYKSARQFVGEKKGLDEVMSDDFSINNAGYEEGRNFKKNKNKDNKKSNKYSNKVAPSAPRVIAVLTNVKLPEVMTVKHFAESIKKTSADVIKKLMLMGIMASQNQEIDFDTAAIIASEFGITAEKEVVVSVEELLFEDDENYNVEEDPDAVERPPVVVVMGHVDHGKTSLLDAIRSANVTAGEAGGITQHIGAYTVMLNDRPITFLDTPGHEAFTAMRARGAQVTDVAIIVVAADDGVMPQTIEAINHAKAANVTIIVAVNKIDKQGANVDRVKQEMVEHGLVPEEWGGDTIFVPVSARNHQNIDELLENVLLSADILQLKANPDKQAFGTIIEAKLDKNKGPVATLLVQRGTLRQGDTIISGTSMGHVRTMTDDKGRSIKEAGPSTPVEITGMPEVPEAGEVFNAVKDEKLARQLVEKRKDQMREKTLNASSKVSLQDLFSQIQSGDVKELNIVVKADVQGSVEAVKQSLEKLSTDEVKVKVIHGGVGAVTESDVTLAQVSNAIIIGFNVRPGAGIAESAEAAGVDVRLYRIIYDAIDDVKAAMIGMLDPEFKEVVTGHVEIRQTFKVSGVGTIAGCYVTDGKIVRNSDVRIVRDGIVIFEGKLASLKRFKDDVKEVQQGFECGLSFERFNDIKEGDVVEAFVMEEIKRG